MENGDGDSALLSSKASLAQTSLKFVRSENNRPWVPVLGSVAPAGPHHPFPSTLSPPPPVLPPSPPPVSPHYHLHQCYHHYLTLPSFHQQ
ncbi:hypothetical protein M0802_009704 [Mischocyttarus mexicanus]|nr:hypothetical protein M0802_009704 [Mischocyttarus mexicanus]